jgi:hypothetical protein
MTTTLMPMPTQDSQTVSRKSPQEKAQERLEARIARSENRLRLAMEDYREQGRIVSYLERRHRELCAKRSVALNLKLNLE